MEAPNVDYLCPRCDSESSVCECAACEKCGTLLKPTDRECDCDGYAKCEACGDEWHRDDMPEGICEPCHLECADGCGWPTFQCHCGAEDDSMDGDHESALESVYGPADYDEAV